MGYMISAYFDSESKQTLSRYIRDISEVSGNDFMIQNTVPPHLTISFFEARSDDIAKMVFQEIRGNLKQEVIAIPSVGVFFPHVIYAEAVQNAWLFELSNVVNEEIKLHDEVIANRYYRPFSWIPHITLGKTLSDEQMREAFIYLQKSFCPMTAKVERFSLAKTNPHREILSS